MTGSEASGLKEKSKTLKHGLYFDDLGVDTDNLNCADFVANESSFFGKHKFSKFDVAPTSTPEYGSSRSEQKRKASLILVMKDDYKTMAVSIDKLSKALVGTGEKVAGNKFNVSQNSQIFDAISSLALEENYKVNCYFYLGANPSKAALLVAAPNAFRGKLLKEIMAVVGDEQ